ncbi:MAG TPA: hypothetical protein VJR93_05190 [Chthoniobacterales bacterium]|nr:hypothetical protein [Chthoniobacterales bacterium]
MFGGTKSNDFVYLYSRFGNADPSQAEFEEWALLTAPSIPELNALFFIIGLSAIAFATEHSQRRAARLGV